MIVSLLLSLTVFASAASDFRKCATVFPEGKIEISHFRDLEDFSQQNGVAPFTSEVFDQLTREFYGELMGHLPIWKRLTPLSHGAQRALFLYAQTLAALEQRNLFLDAVELDPYFESRLHEVDPHWLVTRALYRNPSLLLRASTSNIALDLVRGSQKYPGFIEQLESLSHSARRMKFNDLQGLMSWVVDLSKGATTFEQVFQTRFERMVVQNRYIQMGPPMTAEITLNPDPSETSLSWLLKKRLAKWLPFTLWAKDPQSGKILQEKIEGLHVSDVVKSFFGPHKTIFVDSPLFISAQYSRNIDAVLAVRLKITRPDTEFLNNFSMSVVSVRAIPISTLLKGHTQLDAPDFD